MALYFTRSSSGKNASTASMSALLPAALVLWMMTARGRASLRDVQARYAARRLTPSPTSPQASKVSAIAVDQVRRAEERQGLFALRTGQLRFRVSGAGFEGLGESIFLLAFEGKEQLAQVALDEVLFETGLLGGPFDEPAPVRIAQQVDAVEMEAARPGLCVGAFLVAKPQSELHDLQAVVLLQAAYAILARTEGREAVIATLGQRGLGRWWQFWLGWLLFLSSYSS